MSRLLPLLALCLTGCAMPGFSVSMGFTLPPTIIGANTVAAMPTQAMPAYAIEAASPLPVITRQYSTIPSQQPVILPPAPQMPAAPPFRGELIAPPQGCGKPCP